MPSAPEILENVPLASRTTLGIGGAARWFATAGSTDDVVALLGFARDRGLAFLALGGGSNVLVSDQGWPGMVAHMALGGIEIDEREDDVLVRAAAGEPWDDLVANAVDRGWAGIECLSGIPGLVGATPIQNVGAYGQEVAETIIGVEVIDRLTLKTTSFSNPDCGFRYRDSRFKSDEPDRWIITAVTYRLQRGGAPSVRYADLARYFEGKGNASPALEDVREAVLAVRRGKGMVVDPSDPDSRSAGSFFTNPIASDDVLSAIRGRIRETGLDPSTVPSWPIGEGRVKLSAAWLVESSGFGRGFARGRVGLSTKHTLAIVNRGGASASEVADLAAEIERHVFETFGVNLVAEPRFVGPFSEESRRARD